MDIPVVLGAETPGGGGPAEAKKRPPTSTRRPEKVVIPRPERSLYCFTLTNPLRKLCYAVVEWK